MWLVFLNLAFPDILPENLFFQKTEYHYGNFDIIHKAAIGNMVKENQQAHNGNSSCYV
jgi:hypothetical protein